MGTEERSAFLHESRFHDRRGNGTRGETRDVAITVGGGSWLEFSARIASSD